MYVSTLKIPKCPYKTIYVCLEDLERISITTKENKTYKINEEKLISVLLDLGIIE